MLHNIRSPLTLFGGKDPYYQLSVKTCDVDRYIHQSIDVKIEAPYLVVLPGGGQLTFCHPVSVLFRGANTASETAVVC